MTIGGTKSKIHEKQPLASSHSNGTKFGLPEKNEEKPLLEISASSHFDYSAKLNEYGKEFKKRLKEDKPSPHINPLKFDSFPVLGIGQYGTVRLMKMDDGQICALKILEKDHIVISSCVEKVITERKILFSANFPFLVSLLFSSKDNDFLYIGMPFYAGSDLFNLHRRNQLHGSMPNVKCLYRDLKLENILIDAKGYLKLTDFGLSKLLTTSEIATTLCGTPEYLSPEMLNIKPYSYCADWWTFGIFLFELVAGQTPFSQYRSNSSIMYSKICQGEFEIPSTFSSNLRNLIRRLLDVCMGTRIGSFRNGCNDIKNHNFFHSINWSVILSQSMPGPYMPRLLHPADTFYFRKFSCSSLLDFNNENYIFKDQLWDHKLVKAMKVEF